jgi:Domain of unknown function (DUF4304)
MPMSVRGPPKEPRFASRSSDNRKEGQDVPIDTETAARDAVQRWLDAHDPGEHRVTALLDLGPLWRVMWAGVTNPGYVNLSRLDKETGEIEYDLANAVKIGSSARDTFAEMMKTTVKPEMKELGLRVSGTTFQLPTPDHYAALSIQQSRDNVWVRLKFTVNVRVVSDADWAAHVAETGDNDSPNPNTHEGVGWWNRLGHLTPERKDWWTIWGGFPTEDVAKGLVTAIRDYGLPAMREQIKAASYRD